jgi:hypothetical protein
MRAIKKLQESITKHHQRKQNEGRLDFSNCNMRN